MRAALSHTLVLLLAAALCHAHAAAGEQPQPGQQHSTAELPTVGRDANGRVNVKLPRDARVAVDNRTTGRITVRGWDRDFVEAVATSELGVEYVSTKVDADSSGTVVSLRADYADEPTLIERRALLETRRREFETRRREMVEEARKKRGIRRQAREAERDGAASPGANAPAAPRADSPPAQSPDDAAKKPSDGFYDSDSDSREIHLEVKVPRRAEMELIRVFRSDVEVTDVDTHVVVGGDKSTIRLSGVGSAEVRTKSGPVEVENVGGLLDVTTTSGPVRVRGARGDVRVLSISGEVTVSCARGRVIVANTDGAISLEAAGGDVDASTTNGDILFVGSVRGGRYSLKSMSGRVVMKLRPDSGGFTAALTSYRGSVDADFPLKITQSSKNETVNRRLVGRHGDGRAQVALDTFDGAVSLSTAAAGASKDCQK